MISPDQFVLSNWGPRPVSPAELLRFFLRLNEATLTWGEFHHQMDQDVGDSVSRVPLKEPALAKLLQESLLGRELDSTVMDGAGASLALWNGAPKDDTAAVVDLRMGAVKGRGLLNMCRVSISRLSAKGGREGGAVLRAVVEVWQPEYAWCGTYDHRERQDAGPDTVGRITFIRHPHLLPDLPDDVTVEPVPGGVLLTLQDGPVDHLERAKALREQLKDSGALPDPPITSVVP